MNRRRHRFLVPAQTSKHQPCVLESLESRCMLSVAPILFTDGDGTAVKISLAGNGAMTLTPEHALLITGSDQGTRITISTKGGDGRATLTGIAVTGAMKSISGKNVDVQGNISVSGSLRTLTIGDIPAGQAHTFTIGGTAAAVPVTLTLRRIVDLDIESLTPIRKLAVTDWDALNSTNRVAAPVLTSVTSKEDFAPDVRLISDQEGTAALGSVSVKGAVGGKWFVDGDAKSVTAGSTSEGFRMSVAGTIKKISTKTDMSGVVSAATIGTVSVRGSMVDAMLLAGADLRAEVLPGVPNPPADLYFAGTIKSVSVNGEVNHSVVGAGLDPTDGIFNNGNDFVTGKKNSTITTLKVRGVATPDSLFAAGKFVHAISIGRTRVDPAGDPRFLLASTAPDSTPPVITATLKNDTGTAGDGTTSDPTVVGRVIDLGKVETFRVGIDAMLLTDFVNIRKLVQPDGTFELLRAKIEQINGGPLTPGVHTINLLAKDDVGNTAAIFTVTFTFAP